MPAYFDSLVHVTPDGRWFNTAYDASESRLLKEMDEAHVERAVLVALAGYIDNAFVLEVCRRHGGRLVAGASLNPCAGSAAEAAAAARDLLKDGPFPVVKLHPRLNGYDLLDARVLAMLDEIASWPRPPLIWLDSLLYPRGVVMQRSPVESVRTVAERCPAVRFVVLHAGGAGALAFFEALSPLRNVVLDLSYSLTRYHGTSVALDHRFLVQRFDRRTVFGSDFPEVPIAAATQAFERLADGLDAGKVENVRRHTLAAWLGAAGTP